MTIPIVYNFRSVKSRWTSTIVAVIGIAGTVGVFVAIVTRAGATSEMTSGMGLDSVKILQDAPGIARTADGPLLTPEDVLVAPIPLLSTGTDANVQIRGVSPNVLAVRRQIKFKEGRMFQPGLSELVVGKNATTTYSWLTLGNAISLGSTKWQIVGIFDAGGSSFDSEVWGDAH